MYFLLTYKILVHIIKVQDVHTKGGGILKNINLINSRKSKGLTQEQLAHIVGCKGRQAVSNWENGYSTPPLAIALKVAEVLEKDVAFLFGYKVQETHTKKEVI